MKMTGFFITHNTKKGLDKIKERIMCVGIDYYKKHKLYPVYCATYNQRDGIFINTEKEKEIEPMELLAFSFSGLVEDEEKVDEIERFGKYRCIISYLDNEEVNIISELIS